MNARTSMLHVRVDDDTKEQATAALDAMGLSVSDAVRIFLKRVVADQAFPLELKVPNAVTRAAMAEADQMIAEGKALFEHAAQLTADLEQAGGQ
jgi:DNA-damage-inducible protein J